MDYALLDWDNTLRQGYTLFSWIDYLIEVGTVGSVVREEIDYYIEEYLKDKISHDQLARDACDVFAKSIKGMKRSILEQQIKEYMREDKAKLYGFTQEIFDVLNENRILPIIVSGAPRDILDNYRIKFNIYKIYGFVAEEDNDRFSGKVLHNYGYNKNLKVEEICKEMGKKPKIAFGDSVSDFEMLSKAEKSIIVCENRKHPKFKADGTIEHNMSSVEVRRLLKQVLS